ncbi:MAG: hypothetical protein P8R46_06615, partial [Planctomycetota bacterium]|nr:hypothetical protein [Planctomycetota bacterium]
HAMWAGADIRWHLPIKRNTEVRTVAHLADLVELAGQLANPEALVVLSTYAVGHSPLAFVNLFGDLEGGSVEAGELAIPEAPVGASGTEETRWLPAGFCARWARGCAHDRDRQRGA